jgi:hypothetical protein
MARHIYLIRLLRHCRDTRFLPMPITCNGLSVESPVLLKINGFALNSIGPGIVTIVNGILSRDWTALPREAMEFGHSGRNWPLLCLPAISADRRRLVEAKPQSSGLPKLKGLTRIRFISSYRVLLCLIESFNDIMRRCWQVRACVDWPAPPRVPMHLFWRCAQLLGRDQSGRRPPITAASSLGERPREGVWEVPKEMGVTEQAIPMPI